VFYITFFLLGVSVATICTMRIKNRLQREIDFWRNTSLKDSKKNDELQAKITSLNKTLREMIEDEEL
jgi:hypothetical protein